MNINSYKGLKKLLKIFEKIFEKNQLLHNCSFHAIQKAVDTFDEEPPMHFG